MSTRPTIKNLYKIPPFELNINICNFRLLVILFLRVLQLHAGIDLRGQVNRVLGMVDNDLECGLAIAWCSGHGRLETCIVKVVLLQIEVIILSEDRDPIASSTTLNDAKELVKKCVQC